MPRSCKCPGHSARESKGDTHEQEGLAISAALVALAAFAIAPAVSSAAFLKETVGGAPLVIPAGKKVVAYNELGTSVNFNAGAFTVECSETTLTGTVHANHDVSGNVLVTIEDVWFRGSEPIETRCTDNGTPAKVLVPAITNEGGKQHWCIKNPFGTDEFLLEPWNCTEAGGQEFTFVIVTTGMTCAYHRAASLKGTVTTGDVENKPVIFKMNPGRELIREVSSPFICPEVVKIENFLFQMYTDTALTGPTYRDPASVEDPIFLE
jgi:hypothetical protein